LRDAESLTSRGHAAGFDDKHEDFERFQIERDAVLHKTG